MIVAIIIGFLVGVPVAFYVSKWLLGVITDRLAGNAEQRRYMKSVAIVFGAIALAPAIFLTVMVGAYISGQNADAVSQAIGLGAMGIPLALTLGLIVVTTVIVAASAATGALFGFLAARG